MPALTPIPDQSYLKVCFDYDSQTGDLIWKRRPRSHFRSLLAFSMWNGKNAGKKAGSPNPVDLYFSTKVDGRLIKNHRIIWKLIFNEEPEVVDHINRVRTDNRVSNLRACSRDENAKNRTVKAMSATGLKGVHKKNNRFQAYIQSDKKFIILGSFASAEEAAQAHREAAIRLHGSFASFG